MKIRNTILFIAVPAVLVSVISLAAQTPTAKPKFEVVSIKANKSGPPEGTTVGARGSTFSAVNATMRMVLLFAFRPNDGTPLVGRLVGGPAWLDTDRFDVLGKLEGDARSIPLAQIQLMVQSLLEERFGLVAHPEIRTVPVFNLVVEKPGKLKLSADQSAPNPPGGITFGGSEPLARGWVRTVSGPESTSITGSAVTIPRLISVLQGRADRIIFDQTNLSGLFDFTLKFSSDTTPVTDGTEAPALPTALGELGLKLESGKAPREVVVIDSVQKPTEN